MKSRDLRGYSGPEDYCKGREEKWLSEGSILSKVEVMLEKTFSTGNSRLIPQVTAVIVQFYLKASGFSFEASRLLYWPVLIWRDYLHL